MTEPGAGELSALERRVAEAVDVEGILALVADLVPIRSLTGEAGEVEAQEWVAEAMEAAGLELDVWELDFEALRAHPAYSAEVERGRGLGVVGRLGAGEGPTLVLNGHVDVVPAGEADRWSRPPWRATVEDGWVYGRGTADMKGAVCAAVQAAKALRDAGARLEGTLSIQSVIGEEDGGSGTLAAVLRGHTGEGAVVLEPTRLAVAPAQAGALNFRLTVPGRAAHGALRAEGVDPVEKFVPLFRRIRELEADRNQRVDDPLYAGQELPFPVCMGKLRAGEWASNVAESLVCEGRFGVAPGEDPATARGELEDAVEEVAREDPWLREHPPTVEWWGAQFAPARTPPGARVVTALGGAYRAVTGREAEVRGMPYGADMRLLAQEGSTPSVLFGPGDVRDAHRPDERVAVEELATAARAVAVTALRFCGAS